MVPSGNGKTVIFENEIVLYEFGLCCFKVKTRTVEEIFQDCETKALVVTSLFTMAA